MKKFKLLSSLLATLMVLSVLMVVPVSAATTNFEGPYDFDSQTINTTTVNDGKDRTDIVTDQWVTDILECRLKFNNTTNWVRLIDMPASNNANGTAASGKVLSAAYADTFYLLNLIDGENGIEVYEFDYINTNGGKYATLNGTRAFQLLDSTNNNNWHHVRIEYDTVNDTFTSIQDNDINNELGYKMTINNVTELSRLQFTLSSRSNKFLMDNYHSYVITEEGGSEPAEQSFDITNADGSAIAASGNTGANGLGIKVTAANITKLADKSSVTVIYAFYKDNELVDANSQVVNVVDGGFSQGFTTKANVAYDSVKAFIWDGLTTMTPLVVAKSYPAE